MPALTPVIFFRALASMNRAMLVAGLCLAPITAVGSPTILAGHHELLPNTPGQTVPVFASGTPGEPVFHLGQYVGGGDAFLAVDFAISIGDTTAGPVIVNVDLVGPGTIFHPNNTGQANAVTSERSWYAVTATNFGSIGPNGVLGWVTFDTTGIGSGVYEFKLSMNFGDLLIPSDLPPFYFPGFGPTPQSEVILVNGTLTIVPEPGAWSLANMAALILAPVLAKPLRRKLERSA